MTAPLLYVRSQIRFVDGLCSWACVCGAGRVSTDGAALRQEREDHMPNCRAKFTRRDELPLALLRPGWYVVADARPCVVCGKDTDVRSTRRKPCHIACADRWASDRTSNHESQRSPRVAVPTQATGTEGSGSDSTKPRCINTGATRTTSKSSVTGYSRQEDPITTQTQSTEGRVLRSPERSVRR